MKQKKKRSQILIALAVFSASVVAKEWAPAQWPVLKHYDEQHLYQIALPLGGIGTGTVSLGGRGELRDWEIMNIPAKKYSTVTPGNNAPFFAIGMVGSFLSALLAIKVFIALVSRMTLIPFAIYRLILAPLVYIFMVN